MYYLFVAYEKLYEDGDGAHMFIGYMLCLPTDTDITSHSDEVINC